ncbi:MAG: hypothetical protein KatS3mg110_0947 [Pirellulaceae bacterium]|nr:MAG: hypothetical protein KatS3mg110_0947 [Pirellulaceae bacterium]
MRIRQDCPDFAAPFSEIGSNYYGGIARIDREFNEACQSIALSTDGIQGQFAEQLARSNRAHSEQIRLCQEAEMIEREINRIETELAKLDQGLAAVEMSLRELVQHKASLERQIQNRWLVERIIYLFMNDKNKQQLIQLQSAFDKKAQEKSQLEEMKLRFETMRSEKVAQRNEYQSKLEHVRHKLSELRTSAEKADARRRLLADKLREMEQRRQRRKENLLAGISAAWKRTADDIARKIQPIKRQQPSFAELGSADIGIGTKMPDFLILGTKEITFLSFRCWIPHCIAFPFQHGLILPEDNQAQRRLAHHLLLRLLQAIPPGRLELTFIDPIKLGQSFDPFLPLLNVGQLVPERRMLTRADEIEQVLGKLMEVAEKLIQYWFKGRISNWAEFNAAHPDQPLGYKVLLLFDVPAQLSDKSLWYLERLIENGPRCGILPIVAVDAERIAEKRYEKLYATLTRSTQRLDACLPVGKEEQAGLWFSYVPEEWPPQDVLDDFLSRLAKQYVEHGRLSKVLQDLWQDFEQNATTIGGFEVPIGWTPSGETVSLRLGAIDSEHHALLGGKTGSGKSNLLHVIIHSLCEKYGPGEVDLYLLDYKESTEFTVYANPPLPHARLVATESDPEYGITVLQHLVEEMESRAGLFKSAGVRDFSEYRTISRIQLPRVLLIIDEFQVLFTEDRSLAERAEKLLGQLLKQGRAFGIHLILATQTLKGVNAVSLGSLISQLGCRIALACTQEDSALILAGNNWAAAELKSPPEAIINNANGARSGNVQFNIPLAEREFCGAHLEHLAKRAQKKGIPSKVKVFSGANLPVRPPFGDFNVQCRRCNALLLGECLTFSSEALWVPLVNRQGFNILFSGYNDLIHDGLLVSSLASIVSAGDFDEVMYFNGRGIEPRDAFIEIRVMLGERLKIVSEVAQLPLQEIADAIGKRRIALIIDGLDSEKSLQPVQMFKSLRHGEPVPPADLLKRVAEEGPEKGTFVFVFIDNWRRCAGVCKELLTLFELRVAFCMNEDDAGALVSGGIAKFKGIEKPNRAVFVNRMTNDIQWFRPYIGRPQVEQC